MNLVHDSSDHRLRPPPHGRRRPPPLQHPRRRPDPRRDARRDPAAPRARRSLRAARLRAGAPAPQGAARHRPGDRRRPRHRSTASRASRRRRTATSTSSSIAHGRRRSPGSPAPRRRRPAAARGKTIVEHTAINPNKAAHIGHLRNAALGDAFGRLLRFLGREVEIQNYIDDTGVQVADVAVGFRELENIDLDDVRALADSTRFDYYCWDLYASVTEWYEEDKARLKIRARRAARHRARRQRHRRASRAFIADRIVRCHLETMRRLNIGYDLLTWEGDILRLHFWAHAFEFLKKTGAVFLQTEGKLTGCWVMKIEDDADGRRRGRSRRRLTPKAEDEPSARRSSSAPTAPSPTSARTWRTSCGSSACSARTSTTACSRSGTARRLWSTTLTIRRRRRDPPSFGRASWVCNVIDTRQSYLQKLLKQALARARLPRAGGALDALRLRDGRALARHRARARLRSSEADSDRPFVEVSGRKGLGVKADDLLDRLIDKASGEVAKRNAELSRRSDRGGRPRRSRSPRVRYFMVKFSRGKVIIFDIDEALSFEGESGPYLQYAVVRANNIFNKLKEREGLDEAGVLAALSSAPGRPADERQRRSARSLGARPRSGAARRRRGAGDPHARVVGAREIRVRPRAVVQRLLPPLFRSSTRSGRRRSCGARRRSRTTGSS